MCPDKKRPAENTCRIVKGLDAVWAHFCPSKPCLPLSIDGSVKGNRQGSLSCSITRRSDQNRKIKYCFLFCDFASACQKSPNGLFDKLKRTALPSFLVCQRTCTVTHIGGKDTISIGEGKHACQRVFPALFVPFTLAGASPPASQKPKITRKSIAGRCFAVLSEQKCAQTRKGPQRILAVLSRGLTQYGRISARQNRVCPCRSMVV